MRKFTLGRREQYIERQNDGGKGLPKGEHIARMKKRAIEANTSVKAMQIHINKTDDTSVIDKYKEKLENWVYELELYLSHIETLISKSDFRIFEKELKDAQKI